MDELWLWTITCYDPATFTECDPDYLAIYIMRKVSNESEVNVLSFEEVKDKFHQRMADFCFDVEKLTLVTDESKYYRFISKRFL